MQAQSVAGDHSKWDPNVVGKKTVNIYLVGFCVCTVGLIYYGPPQYLQGTIVNRTK